MGSLSPLGCCFSNHIKLPNGKFDMVTDKCIAINQNERYSI